MEFKQNLKKYQDIVNEELEKYLRKDECPEKILNNSMEYSLMAGGKRLRPILVLATYELFRDDFEEAMPFAVAIEMIHNFSLIHDDLPEVDNDDFRHGKPTNHKQFNHPTALLAGDGLLNQAYMVLSEEILYSEENQYKEIINLLEKHNPDILVITGHDALTSRKGNITDLNNYRNSLNFIKAVKQARKWEPNLDNLVIFAGACQSNYEQLIRAGANYASSPGRIMIHALDPVFVVEKIACSRIDTIVPIEEVIEQTVTGLKGIGGSETRGKFRWAMPKSMLY